ncbi:hypothetical protein HMPREF3038_02070 [Akkermansia sp. KLE1797]|nr:hypothetical protein HMPREF3038_02070 [Akkermansia sp. KLE1797]KXU53596.1 hypothetical protein HMPREF3039_02319 [Akkermansia sp. KLE1798]KZA05792.1 hypothetical protein HMPREF1326_00619 [Akkermansia sp. KLE1605]
MYTPVGGRSSLNPGGVRRFRTFQVDESLFSEKKKDQGRMRRILTLKGFS